MSIEAGSRLGPYEIVSHLGAGGMGEVWKARDTRVGREVAIKVLPSSLASNEERLARFEQEARAAAALNHPNLLTIHDVGAAEGVPYIVTELLEGESLRERLGGDEKVGSSDGHSPIPTRKAIEWASAVAIGLAAAHEKGVVHRDLKPDNVFVTTDGRVKILDFGLAKLATAFPEGASDEVTQQRNTSPGSVMGTVGYMSPEQVRGRDVDHRSDIFSLGAMLYEMLSGRRAFRGDSAADTMSAILREDPPELATSGVEISAGLERIVRRCLEKNPEERFHSAHDLAYALDAISGSSARSTVHAALPEKPRRPWELAAVAGALALAIAFFAGRSSMRTGHSETDGGASPMRLVQLTNQVGIEHEPALSPDGTSFVYSALVGTADDLFLQRVGGGNPINLTNSPEDEGYGAFSPDGTRIAFSRGGSGVWTMGATGESIRRLTDFGSHPAWAPDGKTIVVTTLSVPEPSSRAGTGELWRIDVASGQKTKIDVGGVDGVQPSCSPDGKWVAFWGVRAGTAKRILYVVPAGGGKPIELTDDDFIDWSPVWEPGGRAIVFASDRGGNMNLWRMPIDPVTGTKAGPPRPVTASTNWSGRPSIAKTGAIAFTSRSRTWSITRTPLDLRGARLGAPVTVVAQTTSLSTLNPSPDGRSIAVVTADPDEDIVAFKVDDPSKQVRLTNDAFRDRSPQWSGDGARIFFFSDRSGTYECWSVRADGSDLRQETRGGFNVPTPSPDGVHLAAQGVQSNPVGWVLFDLRVPAEARKPEPLPPPRDGLSFNPLWWSSDSTRLIGLGLRPDGSAPPQLLTYTLATKAYTPIDLPGEYRPILGTNADLSVIVRLNTRALSIESVDLRTRAIHTLGKPPLTTQQLAVTRDGTAFYSLLREEQSDIWLLEPGQ